MIPSTRIVVGTVLFFLIMGAGFASGFYFFKLKNEPSNGLTPFKEAAPKINNNTYTISPPSRGAGITTKPVPIHFENGLSVSSFTPQEAAEFKTGTKIMLYDKDNKLLNVIGEVTSVGGTLQDTPEKVYVTISLMDEGIVGDGAAVRGAFVASREPDLPRLPLKSLVQNDKGAPYVWEVHENQDGTNTAYLKAATILMTTDRFVAIEVSAQSSNMFVLNPDGQLEDGQTINVKKTLYAGPERTDDQMAEESMEQFQKVRNAAIRDTLAALPVQSVSSVCGSTGNAAQDFINTIKLKSPPRPESLPIAP